MHRTGAILNSFIIIVALGATASVASSHSRNPGNSRTQHLAAQNQSLLQSQIQSNNKPEVQTFSGTIWMDGNRFELRDERERRWYHLDADQKLIAKFEGKEVKVTGTLDPATSEIHVQRIEEG
jgi:hypothetical protein